MDQHPVPRNITGFKFQLIGSMTLKQFSYLLVGLFFAFMFYNSPISIFRFPMTLLAAAAGGAFAFLPIQERPLEVWLMNFVRSVYQPTQFVWKKSPQIPDFFLVKTVSQKQIKKDSSRVEEQRMDARQKLDRYLQTTTPHEDELLDQSEAEKLKSVSDMFGPSVSPSSQIAGATQPSITPSQPGLKTIDQIHSSLPYAQPPQKAAATAQAVHADSRPPRPVVPAQPTGVISGLLRDNQTPIPNMLVHVYDAAHKPVRLFKTNAEGKFTTSIVLAAGDYSVEIEDPNGRFVFRPFPFRVGDEPLRPWLITPQKEVQ